jgi:hypothetical protein
MVHAGVNEASHRIMMMCQTCDKQIHYDKCEAVHHKIAEIKSMKRENVWLVEEKVIDVKLGAPVNLLFLETLGVLLFNIMYFFPIEYNIYI